MNAYEKIMIVLETVSARMLNIDGPMIPEPEKIRKKTTALATPHWPNK